MPDLVISVTAYEPDDSDENPSVYLQRCGEALMQQYGYHAVLMLGPADPTVPGSQPVRQLQITIPDDGTPGGKRAVLITAPEAVMDVAGDVMTATTYNARYGS